MRVAALIPAKKISHRIPNKNLIPFGNTTLLEYKLSQLQNSHNINDIYVGTDCPIIANISINYGAIPIYRDPICCDESKSTANMMIADFIKRINCDILIWIHLTNPFVDYHTYDMSIDTFLKNEINNFDSLISVYKLQEHLWNNNYTPINYNPWDSHHTLAKDLPILYKQTGAFFIQRHKSALQNNYFFGKKPYLYCTTDIEAIDINTEFDLILARGIYHELFSNS